ncbi:MAG TPA: hypothetical protein VNE16_10965 [Vicinamibacterales bacterium]|nr:hypothetical protein [Vicinamibacterales bacterium]
MWTFGWTGLLIIVTGGLIGAGLAIVIAIILYDLNIREKSHS